MGAFVKGIAERRGLCVLAWCRGFKDCNLKRGFACNEKMTWKVVMISSLMTQKLTLSQSVLVRFIQERANKNEFQLTGHAHKERQEDVINKDVA